MSRPSHSALRSLSPGSSWPSWPAPRRRFRLPSSPIPQLQKLHQCRSYVLLNTTLNPTSSAPKLPDSLPGTPKTILLLTTPHSAASLTKPALSELTNDGRATLLSAVVDSLPGSYGKRNAGHSWLITDQKLPITLPPAGTLARSLNFALPTTSFNLPLANTVFQTGSISTLLHLPATAQEINIEAPESLSKQEVEEFAHAREDIQEVWEELGELMKVVGQRAGINAAPSAPVGSVNIRIPQEVLQEGSGRIYTQLPLKALTPARQIADGMGNILRKTNNDEGVSQAASRELELKVPEYIDALPENQRPNKVDVFARLTTNKPSPDQSEMLLAPGTRIHRVLSGGGGWGSKAGLLSLDPQGESEVESFAQEFEARFSGEEDSVSPKSGVVQVGEWVQFFVAGENSPDIEEKGIRLGCVRKVEEVEDDTTGMGGEEKVIEGLFGGAAEEGGVDITVAGKRRRMDVPGGVVVVDV